MRAVCEDNITLPWLCVQILVNSECFGKINGRYLIPHCTYMEWEEGGMARNFKEGWIILHHALIKPLQCMNISHLDIYRLKHSHRCKYTSKSNALSICRATCIVPQRAIKPIKWDHLTLSVLQIIHHWNHPHVHGGMFLPVLLCPIWGCNELTNIMTCSRHDPIQ